MIRPFGDRSATRSVVLGLRGMVATSQPLATRVGVAVLERGGTALDAAIAANATLCVTEPTGCGIGGDLFAMVWQGGVLSGFNGSGRSPLALSREHFVQLGLGRVPSEGPLSVSVPGAVDAWFALHERFGRLPMADLLAPAADYAREGFPVTEIIAGYWAAEARRLGGYAGFAQLYLPGGRAPAAGDVFRNPRLADAYELIGRDGRDAFYRGAIAREIAEQVRGAGGYLAEEDLARHQGAWVEPISTEYRGYCVWQLPPNTQGIAVLQMLNVLEGYDLERLGCATVEHLHLLVEAKKLAFEDRARHYADPAFADVPVAELVSKEYAAARRVLIDPRRAANRPAGGDPRALAAGDTVYLAAADREGQMVSLIQSNYLGMGSGIAAAGFGFMLQNRGELFSLDDRHPNRYEPGKRPFHTIIPGFVTRAGELAMSFGVMGADMQPQGHVQVLTNLIDFRMNLQEAGDAPRVRHEGSSQPTGAAATDGGTVHLEPGFGAGIAQGLAALGHRVVEGRDGFGGYQAVLRNPRTGVYHGASESRKDGHAAGF